MQVPKADTRLIESIWSRVNGEYVCTATIDRTKENHFTQDYVHRSEASSLLVPILPLWGVDWFFAPLGFTEPKRTNETAAGPFNILFADLDDAPSVPHDLEPSLLWETSPRMKQAVWYLKEGIPDYKTWANLNKRLTYALGGDKGGWMGSKLLRVPQTPNYKRFAPNRVTVGRVLSTNEFVYDAAYFQEVLPGVQMVDESLPHGPVPTIGNHPTATGEERYRKNWYRLSLRGRALLQEPHVRDRSLHIYKTVRELVLHGNNIDPIDVFYIVYARPWNKWVARPEVLWDLICAAAEER